MNIITAAVLVFSLLLILTYTFAFATSGASTSTVGRSIFFTEKMKFGVFTKCHRFENSNYFYEPASGAWLVESVLTKEELLQAKTLPITEVNIYPGSY